jgi:hypothetical protein
MARDTSPGIEQAHRGDRRSPEAKAKLGPLILNGLILRWMEVIASGRPRGMIPEPDPELFFDPEPESEDDTYSRRINSPAHLSPMLDGRALFVFVPYGDRRKRTAGGDSKISTCIPSNGGVLRLGYAVPHLVQTAPKNPRAILASKGRTFSRS